MCRCLDIGVTSVCKEYARALAHFGWVDDGWHVLHAVIAGTIEGYRFICKLPRPPRSTLRLYLVPDFSWAPSASFGSSRTQVPSWPALRGAMHSDRHSDSRKLGSASYENCSVAWQLCC
jgi:hypothetical protein